MQFFFSRGLYDGKWINVVLIHCFSSYLVVEVTVIRNHCCSECMKIYLMNKLLGRPLNNVPFNSLPGASVLLMTVVIVL